MPVLCLLGSRAQTPGRDCLVGRVLRQALGAWRIVQPSPTVANPADHAGACCRCLIWYGLPLNLLRVHAGPVPLCTAT